MDLEQDLKHEMMEIYQVVMDEIAAALQLNQDIFELEVVQLQKILELNARVGIILILLNLNELQHEVMRLELDLKHEMMEIY